MLIVTASEGGRVSPVQDESISRGSTDTEQFRKEVSENKEEVCRIDVDDELAEDNGDDVICKTKMQPNKSCHTHSCTHVWDQGRCRGREVRSGV